jgi:hypothetical protein
MAKTPEELFKERTERVEDAIQLKVPDRVPLVVTFGLFPAKYAGITCEEAFYDANKWKMALKKTVLAFEPDMFHSQQLSSGAVLEALDCKQVRWPGHGVPVNHTHQFVEREYVKADEYDAFLADPSGFALRTYMPRIYGSLEALEMLPPISYMVFGYGVANLTAAVDMPELAGAFDALRKAGRLASKWNTEMSAVYQEMAALGFPVASGATVHAPFDSVSDYFRGMRGAMLDMYRQPDKLLEACEKLLPMFIERGVSGARRTGNPRVFIPLHRGSDGFMSLKQFETFYWPTLKRLILTLTDEGLTPCPFFEGDYTSRLEHLLELPKGKILGLFDRTDMATAKEVLGGHMCIRGNVPSSLLQTGTPQEVKEYCRKLIDVAGKDGGFVMSSGCTIDEAKPENVRAMFDSTKEYGVYR